MPNLGSLTITGGTKTQFKAPPTGIQAVVVGNESGLSCVVSLEGIGIEKTLYPGTVDQFPVSVGFTGVIFVTPTIQIGSAILYPGSFLTFDAIGIGETFNPASYPLVLARPMTAGTTSPQSGFSTFNTFTTGAGGSANPNGINIFNPSNTGVVARLYAAQTKTSNVPGTAPNALLCNIYTRNDGIDNNLNGGQNGVFAHNIGGTGSLMNVTTLLNAAVPGGNSFQCQFVINADLFDVLGPPDSVYIHPGQNFLMTIVSISGACNIMQLLKWTES